MLPPEFDEEMDTDEIRSAIEMTFSNLAPSQYHMAQFLLASLDYHSGYIFANFHSNHLLFNNPLFKDPEMMQHLKSHVNIHNFTSPKLNAAGILPFANVLYQLAGLTAAVNNIGSIGDAAQQTVNGVVEELEQNSVQMNVVTYDYLNSSLRDVVDVAIRNALDDSRLTPNAPPIETEQPETTQDSNGHIIYSHNNRLNLLPANYKIPSTTVPNVLHLYFHVKNVMVSLHFELLLLTISMSKITGKEYLN
eukprot:NODE_189_length_13483_cov_0.581067.p2 type:complete len:249 gc:universal NODE_189_length_13483_cov_0.581067:5953-6699(+)